MMVTKYTVIDTLRQREVVATYPTHRRAFNHARRLEAEPSLRKLVIGRMIREWRYQITPVREDVA